MVYILKWIPFIYTGRTYDLSHLHPFDMEVIQEAKGGKLAIIYNFQVEFSIHCFTRGKNTSSTDLDMDYRDSRETRVFCFDRYALSKQLPEIIKNIGDDRRCYHTEHGNYFIIELIDNETGSKSQYEIFFTISKSRKKKKSLRLYIQSAYVPTDRGKRRKKPIRFAILAYKTQRNEVVRIPK